jgi:hypothetical protein
MACRDGDANGQRLEVFWEREVVAQVLGETTWDTWANGALTTRRPSALRNYPSLELSHSTDPGRRTPPTGSDQIGFSF